MMRLNLIVKACKWLAACGLSVGLVASAWADPTDVTKPEERGTVVERHYDFEAAHQPNMGYALFVPTGYDPAKPAPLVVLLHGLYSNPWQVIHYAGVVAEAEKRGYLVVAPYGYNEGGWYGSRGPGKDFGLKVNPPPHSPDNLGALSEQDVFNVLALVRKEYAVDAKRIYLMGHSMGGGGTLYLGMTHRGLWAALAPMAPAIWSQPEGLADIQDTPIILVQGDQDALVKVESTRRWVDEMRDLKMDYQYIEIKGGDHVLSIAANAEMIGKVFDFFEAHHRS